MKLCLCISFVVCLFNLHIFGVQSQACIKGQVDFLYIIDSSSNVGAPSFDLELRVATNLAENLHIGKDAVQIGAITFADNYHSVFDFNTHDNFINIETDLVHAQYLSGSTATFVALDNARNLFTGSHGARSTASRVAVVFTNGRSSDMARTEQAAALLRSIRVHVIVVGLSNSNSQELQAIAGGPQDVYQIDDFNAILKALQDAVNNTCNVPCMHGQLDVLYVLDSSSSVGNANFEHGLRISVNLAENFEIGVDGVQFAALTFADNPRPRFNFSAYSDFSDLQKAILASTYQTGSTNTSQALEYAEHFFDGSQGDRLGAPNVVVVFTNGLSTDSVDTARQALLLRQSGVYVIAVGYAGANSQELEAIASGPSAVFDINNFNGILKALQDYINVACN
jgi:hypothetical protein